MTGIVCRKITKDWRHESSMKYGAIILTSPDNLTYTSTQGEYLYSLHESLLGLWVVKEASGDFCTIMTEEEYDKEYGHCKGEDQQLYTFGEALEHLKSVPNSKVARVGWNGKGMYITLIPAGNAMWHGFPMQDCLGMKTANGLMQPGWLASQNDMLSNDWVIV